MKPSRLPRSVDAEARVDLLLDRAVGWGLLEAAGDDLRATKRWKDALVRAAAELAREAAECPTCPKPADPIGECVRRAVLALEVPFEAEELEEVVALLAHFELATMAPEKRSQNGYPLSWP